MPQAFLANNNIGKSVCGACVCPPNWPQEKGGAATYTRRLSFKAFAVALLVAVNFHIYAYRLGPEFWAILVVIPLYGLI